MNNQSSDQKLVNFLKQNRPKSPEAAPDLELKLLATIAQNEQIEKELIYRKKLSSIVSIALVRKMRYALCFYARCPMPDAFRPDSTSPF